MDDEEIFKFTKAELKIHNETVINAYLEGLGSDNELFHKKGHLGRKELRTSDNKEPMF